MDSKSMVHRHSQLTTSHLRNGGRVVRENGHVLMPGKDGPGGWWADDKCFGPTIVKIVGERPPEVA